MAWQSLGEVNYQKWPVYDMRWDLTSAELEQSLCIAAPFGGPVALVGPGSNTRLYSMCGESLGTVQVKSSAMVGIGWLAHADALGAEMLVTVLADGSIEGFSVRGWRISKHGLKLLVDAAIVKVCVFSTGIAALLENGKITLIFADERRTRTLNGGKPVLENVDNDPVLCMSVSMNEAAILSSEDRWEAINIIVTTSRGRVLSVTATDVSQVTVGAGSSSETSSMNASSPIVRVSVAPNGRFVAFFSDAGWLTVMNTAFTKTVLEFDTKAGVPPRQMCWSGDDCVVCSWKQLGLLMIGPFGDWVKYTYHDPVFIIQDIDSLRVMSAQQLEILQRVPTSTESILKIGSFAPAAMLCDAVEALDAGDSKADVSLRAIKDEGTLVDAVKECIRSALSDFDIDRQKQLLRAASVGKIFCEFDEERRECASDFLLACNALRVLNIIRHESVGLPLTIQQYEHLGPRRLVGRLAARGLYLLALKICAYLDLSPAVKQVLLMEWAAAKLRKTDTSPHPLVRARTNSASSLASLQSTTSVRSTASRTVGRYSMGVKTVSSSWAPASPGRPNPSNNANATKRLSLQPPGPESPKMQAGVSEREDSEKALFEAIQAKLAPVRGIRYVELAKIAHRSKKRKLASLIAHAEPVSYHRILCLLRFGEIVKALAYAVHTHDPSMILFAILYAWPRHDAPFIGVSTSDRDTDDTNSISRDVKIRQREKFVATIVQFPIARNVFANYCEANDDFQMLREIYTAAKKAHLLAGSTVKEAFTSGSLQKRVEKLTVAVEQYKSDSYATFYHDMVADQIKLLRIQRELQDLTSKACFVDNSLMDTIFNCLILRLDKKAQQLKDEFRVSEAMFCTVRIKALAQLKDWEKLRDLASQKRLPVSHLSFVDACLEADNHEEARFFAQTVKDDSERLQALLKTQMWEAAVHAAVQAKDITTLQLIRNRCDDDDLRMQIIRQVRSIEDAGG